LKRYGIVCRESLKREVGTPRWKDVRRALIRLELLGKVRRGFFVLELSGEQYAYPEAVDALREAKLRRPDVNGGANGPAGARPTNTDEPMILLNVCDPANPFGALFAATNQAGQEIRFMRVPQKYLVFQAGQPVLLYEGRIALLIDLARERAEQAIRTLVRLVDQPARTAEHKELYIRDWNGHPIDVSPARHLLLKLGFVHVSNR